MSDITARLIEMGRDLGLTGPELVSFVKEREEKDREREERERADKKEREERERADKKEREQADREERERADKKEKEQADREERRLKREADEQERQAQLQLARINADIEIAKSNKNKGNGGNTELVSKIPKMAPFSEAKGDTMDAFIFRFEMLVKTYDWSDNSKFLALSNLLTGDSLKVLQTLSLDQQNYESLKQALLKKFLCTASDYGFKFRHASPLSSEDVDSFVSRLEMVFDRWVELSKIEKGDYNRLRDLIIRDQIYSSLHSDIVMFLKERSPDSIQDIRSLADKYKTAHPARPIAKEHSLIANVAKGITKVSNEREDDRSRPNRKDTWKQNKKGFTPRSYSCGPSVERRDHYDHDYRDSYEPRHPNYQRGFRGGRGAYHRRGTPRYNSNRGYRGSYRGQNTYTKPRHEYISLASLTDAKHLPLFPGRVNDMDCSVLRDTGCTCVGIKQSLIKPWDYTGEMATCVMFDGSEKQFPTAYASIVTPFFEGEVVALVLSSPIANAVLGNISGINDARLKELETHDQDNSRDGTHVKKLANTVTRAQTKYNENSFQPKRKEFVSGNQHVGDILKGLDKQNLRDEQEHITWKNVKITDQQEDQEIVNRRAKKLHFQTFLVSGKDCKSQKSQQTNILPGFHIDTCIDLQRKDKSLRNMFHYAEKGLHGYIMDNGILKRTFKRNNFLKKTIVVPTVWRSQLVKRVHKGDNTQHLSISKTKKYILSHFTWPNIVNDIIAFSFRCQRCWKFEKEFNVPNIRYKGLGYMLNQCDPKQFGNYGLK